MKKAFDNSSSSEDDTEHRLSIEDQFSKLLNKAYSSLNRYERKKNIGLALKSFAKYLE